MIPSLNELVLRDTPFADLMNKRIFNILLIATKYDAFMLEDDGRIDEQIFNEYTSLSLRYPPRFTQVTTEEEALSQLADRNFELVIVMPNMAGHDIFAAANSIKQRYPHIPIVVLTPFSREVSRRVAGEDLSHIDYIFSWLGNSELLLAIIKLIEDKLNAPYDLPSVGVQTILLVEDSIRFYSSALPHLYHIILEQSKEFSKEALNDHLKTLRMRGRPKIMLARNYEEALLMLQTYPNNILGVVSDMSFCRNGEKDPIAGYRLGKYLRQMAPHTPLILESSEESNAHYADELGASFIAKHSKSYPQDLRAHIMEHFGFGDFIIQDPTTHKELLRIKDLKDLQKKIFEVPDEALRYHLSHNHFSRFFYSRAIFPPAEILKAHDASQYADMDEARHFIFELIVRYRQMKNAGVVAIYQKERFDEYSNFARIGNGSLGGKGRGLAFMGTLIKRNPLQNRENFHIDIPKTVVICTDIFDAFMESNDLYPIALSDAPDEEILKAFQAAVLPESLLDDLLGLFQMGTHPIAVRSSSLLEDSHYQPFAGVYATYMIPRSDNEQEMLRLLRAAIKAVYASVFYADSKAYLTSTQNLIDQEKMAIVLQEVIGQADQSLFYPSLSGVARSINFYPAPGEHPEDGVCHLAIGLGKQVVDGGKTLRFSPLRPHHILQLGDVETTLRETQDSFLALDSHAQLQSFSTDDGFNLQRLPLNRFPTSTAAARYLFSTYSLEQQRIVPGIITTPGPKRLLATFDGMLQSSTYPLAPTIADLLRIGEEGMGRPVEIEFAMQIHEQAANFYLLQIRPIVDMQADGAATYDKVKTSRVLLACEQVLGNGIISDVTDVIYVPMQQFSPADNPLIAQELNALNAEMIAAGKEYMLVGPGRWGSSDPWLGIPVKWSQISQARVIAECGLPNYAISPSQGTHFFQNITSLGVGYFTLRPYANEGIFAEDYLNTLPVVAPHRFVRHVRFNRPLLIQMDGRNSRGKVALLADD